MPRMDRLSPYRTTWADLPGGGCTVTYTSTEIVRHDAGTITLRSGDWETVTTKRKLNQAARQFALGYGVHQVDGEWFVDRANPNYARSNGQSPYWLGLGLPFVDGMTFPRDVREHLANLGYDAGRYIAKVGERAAA